MLVLGEEARENGLAVSLLERLHKYYGGLGGAAKCYCATLVTNYRCHSAILSLAERLFYKMSLRCGVAHSQTHPDAPFPLLFVCSSIVDTVQSVKCNTNMNEAKIVLKEVAKYAEKWPVHGWGPKDLTQTSFISPTRSQVRPLSIHTLSQLTVWHCSLDHSCFPTCKGSTS